ncbi:MAG: hypothetical protein QM652_02860 [Legionella sp.]|uniref:hypothetical protein n=1 Tax=Legionella sp. TaxID=459 RepID=UPI0039E64DF7
MNLTLQRLQHNFFHGQPIEFDEHNLLNKSLPERINELYPTAKKQIYCNIVKSHVVLNIEYSLLGQQIRTNLLRPGAAILADQLFETQKIVEQLTSAILFAELLEEVYLHYLDVPREVKRLRAQQILYRKILKHLCPELPEPVEKEKVNVGISFTQEVRIRTININLYRLLFVRSKRLLDLLAALNGSTTWYRNIIAHLDKHIDPFLPHLACFFYVPRLTVNLLLLMKHIIPWSWMSKHEREMGFVVRLRGQLLRRWFEIGNDLAWVIVGALNSYVLTGASVPFAIFIAFFGFDVVMAVGRAYIELNRLYQLRKEHKQMVTVENKEDANQLIDLLDDQIKFETLRFGSHVMTTSLIFLAMCTSAPRFAANLMIPLGGAACLVLICFINFALVPILQHYRPQDIVPVPKEGITKLPFFAKKKAPVESNSEPFDVENREDNPSSRTCCLF